MTIKLPTPTSAFDTQDVVLGENGYTISYSYNTGDKSWYISIISSTGVSLKTGLKIMPNQNITGKASYEKPLVGGDLWCIRSISDFSPVGRDNLGEDKTYQIWWITDEEAINGGIDGTIQL